MIPARRLAALLAALFSTGLTQGSVHAAPQANAALTVGVAGRGVERAIWEQTVFHGGLRADVLFGRSSNNDVGVGPYAELLTHAFDEIQFGGGVSALLPVLDSFPIVLSAGVYGRDGGDPFGLEPGVAASLFWGSRSYNFHANYVMTGGLLAEMRLGLGESRETSILVGAQLDLAFMAMPAIFLMHALAGPSAESDPVK